MSSNLICYVDETGQDTEGLLFIVAVVLVTPEERDKLIGILTEAEQVSGKGCKKWAKSTWRQRLDYIRRVLAEHKEDWRGRVYIVRHQEDTDYPRLTATAIVRVARLALSPDRRLTVYIDGLKRAERRKMTRMVRQGGLRVRKIRGRRDHEDPWIRFVDAIAGFVRDYMEGNQRVQDLGEKLIEADVICEA